MAEPYGIDNNFSDIDTAYDSVNTLECEMKGWLKQINEEIKTGMDEDGSGTEQIKINIKGNENVDICTGAGALVMDDGVQTNTTGIQNNAQLIAAINNGQKIVGKYSS